VVGRPNVGKSTLVNAIVGEERVIAFDQPGTTRDPIEVPFERAGRHYTLIDTAGLRRRGKTGEAVEYFSIVKALQAIEAASVAILLLDASTGITEQDAHVAGYVLERGRAVVLAVNKWDAADKEARARMKSELAWKLGFLGFAGRISCRRRRARPARSCARSTPRTRAMARLLYTQADPRDDGRSRAPGAPRPGWCAQAALCAPGRCQPAAHHHPRQRARPRAGVLKRYLEGFFREKFL
jgi:small GTP-binding protein